MPTGYRPSNRRAALPPTLPPRRSPLPLETDIPIGAQTGWLRVEALSFSRGARSLFQNLTFSLSSGDALLVRGRNGSGKTSLLRLLAGFTRPDSGTVSSPDNQTVRYLGHNDGIKNGLSVLENLTGWCSLMGSSTLAFDDALARVGLGLIADLPAKFLSAGQRRRLALARLITSSGHLWIMDEPEAALDDEGQALFSTLLEEHRQAGGMAVIASHRLVSLPDALVLRLGEPR